MDFCIGSVNQKSPSQLLFFPDHLCLLYRLICDPKCELYFDKSLVSGGKSYAPGEEHPFSEFELQLSELVKLMEKVQSKLEESTDPSSAIEKVTH